MRSILHLAFLATAAASSLKKLVAGRSDLTIFSSLLDQFEAWQLFEESSTGITVMAPNDAAYNKLLEIGLDLGAMPAEFTIPILKYHLLRDRIESADVPDASEHMLVQTALTEPNMTQPSPVKFFRQSGELHAEGGLQLATRIVEPDIAFSGGVVHVLDASLVAPHNISATVWMKGVGDMFLQFMEEAGLISELESLHDASLFIPSNEAWQRAESTLATMELEEKRSLLRNHAFQGHIMYRKELSHRQTLATVGGQALQVKVSEKDVILVGNAAVIQADLLWFNGVAHMIDSVIMPEQTNTSAFRATPLLYQDQPAFASAIAE